MAANVTLRLAVVNDTELAAAIAKLRGEWQARSGGDLEVRNTSLESLKRGVVADLLVFPSRYLGEFSEANLLRPIRESLLESKELDFGDILPLVREREIVYGQKVMALPLGSLAPLLADVGAATSSQAPLTDQYAAFALLARAAPLASHSSREAIWFDPLSMKPRLTEPPFVRALAELQEQNQGVASPCEIAGRLRTGKVKSAMIWPCRSNETATIGNISVELLTSHQVYDPNSDSWETTPPRRVTLLATSGRLVGVTTKSRNAASAFRLAGWLAGREIGGQLVTASDGMAICRSSQRQKADDWLGTDNRTGTRQFSERLALALSQRDGEAVPRLPGVDRYLEALSKAVRAVVIGNETPEVALTEASTKWEEITEEFGRDRQRQAYRRCIGIAR